MMVGMLVSGKAVMMAARRESLKVLNWVVV